jgi:hypothetical protein
VEMATAAACSALGEHLFPDVSTVSRHVTSLRQASLLSYQPGLVTATADATS